MKAPSASTSRARPVREVIALDEARIAHSPTRGTRAAARTATASTFALAVGLALALLTLAGCSSRREPASEAPPAVTVTTALVASTSQSAELEVDGTVTARTEVVVASRLAASVASLEVAAGDRVARGHVLVRLDAKETESALDGARASLSAARAAARLASANLARFESLARDEAASALELDRARLDSANAAAQESAAAAAVRRTETDRAQAVLVSPVDGTVVDTFVVAGDLALPGKPLVRVAANGRRVEAAVPESVALALGAEVPVLLGGARVAGRVAEIVAASDAGSRRRTVRVDLPAGTDPVPGTFARLFLPGSGEPRVTVPANAVVTAGGLEHVFVVGADGLVAIRYVRTGAVIGEAGRSGAAPAASRPGDSPGAAPAGPVVEIRSGLVAGERVVVAPPATLRAGAKATS